MSATTPRVNPATPEVTATVGRYELQRLLGRGAMGEVWLATDALLGRQLALKAVGSTGEALAAHIVSEARAVARLQHPNVVGLFDVLQYGGRAWLAMEYVEGGDLRSWLRTPRSADAVFSVFLQIARGLAAAHDAGVVHRDFKPENVMMGSDGRPRVSDFGLASMLGEHDPTARGAVVGTPAYMAPEQFQGRLAGPAADQFAFCVALHEALTGERPFKGDSFAALEAAVLRPPTMSALPAAVAAVLARGLAADPGARFESMRALSTAVEHAWRAPHRRRRLTAAAALGLVATAAAGVVLWPVDPCRDAQMPTPTLPWQAGAAPASLPPAVVRVLEASVPSWREAWRRDCRAHRDGAVSRAEWQRIDGCLAAARDDIELVAAASLGASDPIASEYLLRYVPPPSQCHHTATLARTGAPRDPEGWLRLVEALRTLAHSQVVEAQSPSDAQGEARRAAELASGHAPTRARALIEQARFEINQGDAAAGARSHEEARSLAQRSGAQRELVKLALQMGFRTCSGFQPAECSSLMNEISPLVAALDDPYLTAQAREFSVGTELADAVDVRRLDPVIEAWRQLPGAAGDLGRAQRLKLNLLLARGMNDEALALSLELLPEGAPLGRYRDLAIALSRARALGELKRVDPALELLVEIEVAARRLQLPDVSRGIYQARMAVLYQNRRCEELVRQPSPGWTEGAIEIWRLRCLWLIGRLDEAQEFARQLAAPLSFKALSGNERDQLAIEATVIAILRGDSTALAATPPVSLSTNLQIARLSVLGQEPAARTLLRSIPAEPPAVNYLMRSDLAMRELRYADAEREADLAFRVAVDPRERDEAELRRELAGLQQPGADRTRCKRASQLLTELLRPGSMVIPPDRKRLPLLLSRCR